MLLSILQVLSVSIYVKYFHVDRFIENTPFQLIRQTLQLYIAFNDVTWIPTFSKWSWLILTDWNHEYDMSLILPKFSRFLKTIFSIVLGIPKYCMHSLKNKTTKEFLFFHQFFFNITIKLSGMIIWNLLLVYI